MFCLEKVFTEMFDQVDKFDLVFTDCGVPTHYNKKQYLCTQYPLGAVVHSARGTIYHIKNHFGNPLTTLIFVSIYLLGETDSVCN